jgi:GT2 family glycosyltransferase/SAM-dependent methyltransferase
MAHPEQREFCNSVKSKLPGYFKNRLVLDIGSLDINGNNQYLFENCHYIGIDVAPGKNVDIVCKGHELNLPDATFDVIITTECLEHDQYWDKTLRNAVRLLKPGGLLIVTCATTGRPEHGTRRTSPQDAPLLQNQDDWADYYRNLEESDLRQVIDFESTFSDFHFSTNSKSHDLYFYGIKKGVFQERLDYSHLVASNPSVTARGALDETDSAPSILHPGAPRGVGSAVLLHLHYPDLWPEFDALLKALPSACDVYVTLTTGHEDALEQIVLDQPHAVVVRHPNRGRDIAPRLALLRMARARNYDQLLLLHGKKSPHLRNVEQVNIPFLQHKDGDRWRRDLLDELRDSAPRAIAAFAAQPRLGLVGPCGFWLNLRGDPNLQRVATLALRMGIAVDLGRHGYFAGSMFWCRPQALDPLLALNLQLNDFEDESGQTDGTLAHAVERLFALSAERAGYEVQDTTGNELTAPPIITLPWLPEGRWLPHERDWAAQAIASWQNDAAPPPRIALALLPNAQIPSQPSQDSIAAQWFAPQSLIEPSPHPAADGMLTAANRALLSSCADWVGLIDAGDRLAPDALFRIAHAIRGNPQWQVVYTDEDSLTADGQHVNPHCKPDFNLDYLRSLPYVGGLLLIRRDLFEALGGFDPQAEGAEDYDLLLRAWEHLQRSGAGDAAIGHVPEVLYHRLQGSGHTQKSVPEILAAGQQALERHFARLGIAARVEPGPFPPAFRVRWPLPEVRPLVSILIPTRDQLPLLRRAIESLIEKTKYPAYEILIIDNDSQTPEARNYLAAIDAKQAELGGRLRVLRHPGPFNFSAMNNAAAAQARGAYLLLLNNDTAVLHDDWLDDMMGHAVRPDVGIVGAKLLYPDGRIQHAGVILGMRGPAEHPFIGRPPEDRGYFGRAQLVQNLSAVTGACLLVRKSVFEQVGGLDEQAFKVSYNDIDLCLKVREAGYRIVFTPFAILMHEGSASQKSATESKPDQAKLARFAAEKDAMYTKWLPKLAFDPAHNRHLTLASTDFLLEDQPPLSWDPQWRPRPRVLVHPADREGCGEYRIIAPMRALNRAGLTQGWETMRLFEPAEMQRMQPDTLVVQRQMEWAQIEALARHAKHSRAFRVFEIDDLITNLPQKSVHRASIHKDITKRFRKAAALCNRLVVATEPLAKAYAHFTDEVVVQPNYLEAARWAHLRPARAERSKPRVGWAGGVGHTGDLELIIDVVRDTAAEFDWVFFGMCPEALKPLVKEFHPGVPLDQYPAKLAALDLDLAVAPLEDNAFNEAKSHLRLLEYGILGYPVVCSDLVPYQGDFPVTRVPNRYRDWVRALRDAVSDRDALRAQGDALRAKVLANWMMEDHLDTWLKAWLP